MVKLPTSLWLWLSSFVSALHGEIEAAVARGHEEADAFIIEVPVDDHGIPVVLHHLLMGKYGLKPVKRLCSSRVSGFAVLVIGGRELHECLVSGALSKQVFPGIAAAGHGEQSAKLT